MDISYARIFRISLPVIASNALVPVIGMIDMGVIGHSGEVAPLAAVGLGALIVSSIFWLFVFLQVTTTATIGQAISRGDERAATEQVGRALMIAAVISFTVLVTIPWLAPALARLFQASPNVEPLVTVYVAIRLLSLPASLFWRIASGVLIARERTGTVFGVEVMMQLINLVLDLVFVLGLGWGVAGVAWASLIAQFAAMVVAIILIRAELRAIWKMRAAIWGGRRSMGAMLQNSGFVFTRSLGLQILIAYFYFQSGQLGDDVLAVNSILQQFIMFTAMATDGFAVAVEVLTARAIGARDIPALRRVIRRCYVISMILAGAIALIVVIAGDAIFALLTSNPNLQAMVIPLWSWLIASILIGVLSWTLDGVFFGANLGREMMIAMTASMAGYIVISLALVPLWGNNGLWIAFICSYFLRAGGLALLYPKIEQNIRISA